MAQARNDIKLTGSSLQDSDICVSSELKGVFCRSISGVCNYISMWFQEFWRFFCFRESRTVRRQTLEEVKAPQDQGLSFPT